MNKIVGTTIATAAIAGALIWSYLDYSSTEYVCDKCNTQYKPQPIAWMSGMHFPIHRHLKCPSCGNWGWHKKVKVPDEKDFI